MPRPIPNAVALLALVALAGPGCAQVLAAPTVKRMADAVVIHGRIDARTASAFRRLLDDPTIRRLVITSPGGIVSAALDMAEAIHAHQLDVEVPSACFSSCANYVFPAGRHKVVGFPGAVGWHGNIAHVLYLQQTGQASWNDKELAQARVLARREADFFRSIGVDGFVCWFGKIAPYHVHDAYYLSAEDMAGFGIHDVRMGAAPQAADAGVQPLHVDWSTLEAARPQVRLDP